MWSLYFTISWSLLKLMSIESVMPSNHFTLSCLSCLKTVYDPKDCSPPGSSVHGILQARILECIALPSSGGSS